MRWERKGAQSMLHLRAIYLNREWDQFVNYRIEKEQAALYGPGTVYSKVGIFLLASVAPLRHSFARPRSGLH